ncbi:acetylglutamate kinase [Spirochaeta isovalerica]|uniref:Acetylglutamate kinase n=1 Tax=Spirochaeta isovalerica TaxID=150 RepID=A0A841RJN1_9SPIO|nr:acetylglutamate kinase [Spirochaeta isovalerica]MBB6482502.1 acetylglutamate kinase [Spirochaeta isovalerica]
MSKPLMIIKTGGRAAENSGALRHLAEEIKELSRSYDFLLVHGGGAAVSAIQKTYGIEPVFKDGIRMTSEKEMDLVDMGLAGLMNKKIVRLFSSCGLLSVGISGADGSMLTGEPIGEGSRTGRITGSDRKIIDLLLQGGFTPIVSPVSSDSRGGALNINADEAALALGIACKADTIVFLSDIPGILNSGELIDRINEPEADRLIEQGIISGGMIPKVRSSLKALHEGAGTVVIGEYINQGDLNNLLKGNKGTKIWLK